MESLIGSLELITYALVAIAAAAQVGAAIKARKRPHGEAVANFWIWVGGQIIEKASMGSIGLFILTLASKVRLMEIPITLGTAAVALLLADFTYYWKHRIEHTTRLFWTYHAVHHSSEEYDLTTSFRLPWLSELVDWVFFVPMVLVGFDPIVPLIAYTVILLAQFWIHTQAIGKIPLLEGIVNTPSAHRVHHASNARYIDKNFAGILVIWDRLFGTYAPETETVRFGLTKPIGTTNPLRIQFDELRALLGDVLAARTLRTAVARLFMNPADPMPQDPSPAEAATPPPSLARPT